LKCKEPGAGLERAPARPGRRSVSVELLNFSRPEIVLSNGQSI
jgi:hypothetical protein